MDSFLPPAVLQIFKGLDRAQGYHLMVLFYPYIVGVILMMLYYFLVSFPLNENLKKKSAKLFHFTSYSLALYGVFTGILNIFSLIGMISIKILNIFESISYIPFFIFFFISLVPFLASLFKFLQNIFRGIVILLSDEENINKKEFTSYWIMSRSFTVVFPIFLYPAIILTLFNYLVFFGKWYGLIVFPIYFLIYKNISSFIIEAQNKITNYLEVY